MPDYTERANANRRPRNRFEVARVFIECVSCGAYKVLSATEDIPTEEAVRRARLSGWSVAGAGRHKNTRCRECRRRTRWGGSPKREFAERSLLYGMYSRGAARPKPIQRSRFMEQPDNPPLTNLTPTTLPVELLQGEALLAHAEAVGQHGPEWAPPDPLKRCDRCRRHAALYVDGESRKAPRYICGPCGPRVSAFRVPISPSDLRQRAADLALQQFEGAHEQEAVK